MNHTRASGARRSNYPFLTAKERDIETGLDYFLARYYSATQGRFLSPDEFTGGPDELFYFGDNASQDPTFYADLRNPQSLNTYQYSYNNPLRWVDPDGHDPMEPEPPQDPRTVVPLPPIPGMPPLVVPGPSTSTPAGPNDATIIEAGKGFLDTICDYTATRHETMGTRSTKSKAVRPSIPIFSVLLEGAKGSHGYFVKIEVACDKHVQAERLARVKAEEIGLNIVGIDEVLKTDRMLDRITPQVIFVSGRSYFPGVTDKCVLSFASAARFQLMKLQIYLNR